MNCKKFSKLMGDYVNRTLPESDAARAEVHLSTCPECLSTVKELERASVLVHCLDRASTPPGFEERLKTRLASERALVPAGVYGAVLNVIRAAAAAIWGVPGRRYVLRPALTVLLLCVVIAGSLMMWAPGHHSNAPDMDWAYINTCKDDHASFAGANPLGDESAAALRERVADSNEPL